MLCIYLLVADDSIAITCKVRSVVNGSLRMTMGCTNPSLSLMLYILWLNFKVIPKMFNKQFSMIHILRLHQFLVSVSVSDQYQHFLVVSESVRYVTQVPIPPLLYEVIT